MSYRLKRDFPFILYDILFKLNFVLLKHESIIKTKILNLVKNLRKYVPFEEELLGW